MSPVLVTTESSLAERARVVRQQFEASGTNISQWARERGFHEKIVHEVLRGDRACIRGISHKVAVALGIKPHVPPPGVQVGEAATIGADQDVNGARTLAVDRGAVRSPADLRRQPRSASNFAADSLDPARAVR